MPERGSASDFKDAATPKFTHNDVVCDLFLVNEHENLPPVSHQQKCLTNGFRGTFDMKSNYFGLMIPKKRKSFEKLDGRAIKWAISFYIYTGGWM